MEPGLIIIWGVVSCILAIFFGVRERDHKHEVEVLKTQNMLETDHNAMIERRLYAEARRCKDETRQALMKAFNFEHALKQNQIDITCFRAELGLPPRKINRNDY